LRIGADWGLLGISALLGFAIAAVQLFPTAEYLLQSQRASAAEYETAMTYSFWPWRIIGLITPNLFGNPAQGNYWGYGNFWEDAVYIGLLPFLMAIKALTAGARKEKEPRLGNTKQNQGYSHASLTYFLLVIIVISFLFALGKNTPIYPWLYHNIPTFDMFQSPTRFSILMVFSLALLAAIGVEGWRRPENRALYWSRLGTAGAFAVTLGSGLGWFLLQDSSVGFKPTFVPAVATAGFWGLSVGILSLTAPERGTVTKYSNSSWEWGVISLVSLDLLIAGWSLNPGIDLEFYSSPPEITASIKQMTGNGRLLLIPEDEYTLKFESFFTFESFEIDGDWLDLRASLLPNLNILAGIPSVNNYDPLVPGNYARWMRAIEDIHILMRQDLLNLMGVSVLEWESGITQHGVRFVPREGAMRLRWVPCAYNVSDGAEALEAIISHRVNLRAEVVIENQVQPTGKACYVPETTPKIISENPNRIVIQVESPSPGWLVLSDTWYPGWRASVDGEPVMIHKANYLFRAIEIPSGLHQVVFYYQPISLYLGGLISFLVLTGIGGYWLYKIKICNSQTS
jgi:hypothetical protein